MTRLISIIALLVLALTSAAQAAEVNKEGAAHLQKIFQDMIHYQESVSSLTEGGQFVFEGSVTVEPSGTYYAVTLPHTSVVYPDGRRAQLGMVSINATPHDQPGQWVMSVAIPTPIVMLDGAGQKSFQIDIGKQGAAGIWHEDLQQFTKLDAKYQGISMRSFDGTFSALIPQASVIYDLKQDADGTWSGPAESILTNMSADLDNGNAKIHIDEVRAKIDMQGYDPKVLRAYKDNLVAMAETAEASEEGGAVSKQHAIGLYNMIFELINKASAGFSVQYSLNGFSITGQSDDQPPQPFKVQIKQIGAVLAASGFRDNRVSLSLKGGYDGVIMEPAPKDGELMPGRINLDVAIDNVPLEDIATTGQNTLQGIAQNPEMAQMGGMLLLAKIPALLSNAGTTITLGDNHIGNESYDAKLTGKVNADLNAMHGAVGKLRASFRNLDFLIAGVQKRAADPENEKPEETKSFLEKLTTIKGLARTEGASHVLDLEVTPQGQILLNGQDAKTLTPPAAGAAE